MGVVYKTSGLLTGQDLLDADQRLREELRVNPDIRYLLVDNSAVSEEQVETRSLMALADRIDDELASVVEGLVAIVAPNEVLFGLSRMWATLADRPDDTTNIARTLDEATAWLASELAKRDLPFRLTD